MTPVIEQYNKLKEKNPDCVLFFRLGDFYEMFGDDAVRIAPLLCITLTKRASDPMCGVPYHSSLMYIDKLLQHGIKVAVSEQDEEGGSKKLMSRSVVRIYTPGTKTEEEFFKDDSESFIASVARKKSGSFELVFCDVSRGILLYREAKNLEILDYEMFVRKVEEIIVLDDDYYAEDRQFAAKIDGYGIKVDRYPVTAINRRWCENEFKAKFGVSDLNSVFGSVAFSQWNALCLLVRFLKEVSVFDSLEFSEVRSVDSPDYLYMTKSTIQALEIVAGSFYSKSNASLFSVMDLTLTPMGRRKLREAVLRPLIDRKKIDSRLDKVEWFVSHSESRSFSRTCLKRIFDIERGAHRLKASVVKKSNLLNIASSINSFYVIFNSEPDFYSQFGDGFDQGLLSDLNEFASTVDKAIESEPESHNLIKDGFDAELDRLRKITLTGDSRFEAYIAAQKEKYGITNMRLAYSRAFGYSIEVSKGQLTRVPSDWTIRQSLVNANRYVNDDFLKIEEERINAGDMERECEAGVYRRLLEYAVSVIPKLLKLSYVIADVDMLVSFAECAVRNKYVRPIISDKNTIRIKDGRHPVVEASSVDDFVSNDFCAGDENGKTLFLLTGPNMAGKSTYLRQNALIIIMAQSGSFVPASEAEIGITKNIFSRIGSADNIAEGESTFYTEMREASYIVRNADERSFVIMDELGRGTSAKDGCAIADAVMRFLAEKKIKCLFATHYMELSKSSALYPNAKNITLEVDESGSEVVFLRKIIDGRASSSYASHAALLAGMPKNIVSVAEKLKTNYENSEQSSSLFDISFDSSDDFGEDKSKNQEVLKQIADFNVLDSTPLEALNFISKIQRELSEK